MEEFSIDLRNSNLLEEKSEKYSFLYLLLLKK